MTELLRLVDENFRGLEEEAPIAEGISFEAGYQCNICQCDCNPGPPGG